VQISVPVCLTLIAMAAASCAAPAAETAGLPCAGPRQSAECIEARRLSALGLTPRPHEMTRRERGELANDRLERELDYARNRAAEQPR
jgi:hypothetical protein